MEQPRFQFSIAALLGVIACIAFNIWLFRWGPLPGIIGLNITKHVVIAWLCQVLGVDKKHPRPMPRPPLGAEGAPGPIRPELLPPSAPAP